MTFLLPPQPEPEHKPGAFSSISGVNDKHEGRLFDLATASNTMPFSLKLRLLITHKGVKG